MPDETVLVSCHAHDGEDHGDMHDERGAAFVATETDTSELVRPISSAQEDETYSLGSDDNRRYIELCSPLAMSKITLGVSQ